MVLDRTRDARRLAERALVWILWELRGTDIEPIVLGGLVPEVLADGQEPAVPAHQGTTDVDLHISVEVDTASADLAALEPALERAGFSPSPRNQGGWQWEADVEGFSIRVDFLCDSAEVPAQDVIPVTQRLGVMNLRGTGYVLDDFSPRTLKGALRSGEEVSVEARFAGLAGYVLTKCASALARQKQKDFYDLAYVVLYNRSGGPAAALEAARHPRLAGHVAGMTTKLREIRERFRAPDSPATRAFVELHEIASPGGDRAQLAQDAIAAVSLFTTGLLGD